MTLLERLAAQPRTFHLFQALRIIEAACRDAPRLGRSQRPAQDPVRLGQSVELAFPPVTITEFRPPDTAGPGRLRNLFFGLFGPMGPLPLHITELARDRERNHGDPTLAAFADLFHHRMTALLYRAWASAEPVTGPDRDQDDFAPHVAALIGMRGAALAGRDAMPDAAKLHFAGRLGPGPRHEEGLLAMVGALFAVPAAVESFVGTWLRLERGDLWRLGAAQPLGRGTTLGARVWTREARFRLRLGPMPIAVYRRFLPGGDALPRLVAVVRNYLGDALEWELNLVLAPGEAPALRLGGGARLGWTSWLGRAASGRAADDLRLNPLRAGHGAPADDGG